MKIIKRYGDIQEFDIKKIETSIKNVARDCSFSITNSDIKYIINSVNSRIKNFIKVAGENRMISSLEIRVILYETLKNCHFGEIANEYITDI